MKRALIAASLVFLATQCQAQSRCKVMDPTGKPLNVRTEPNGRILEALPNGVLVSIISSTRDRRNKPWVYVADFYTQLPIGWVFREFIACY